uniref:ectonucleoside triphosphate diphosphohydrolase 4 isoform X1 n=1 Tax=Myxine glutinosa TaxID=7769 RepID=UPI003590127E
MARFGVACLLPASWHFSCSRPDWLKRPTSCRFLVLLLFFVVLLVCILVLVLDWKHYGRPDHYLERYLQIMAEAEATNIKDPSLSFGIVVDCGSSGSRVFVYYWPPHNRDPHSLLDIRQMRDHTRSPVVKKIKPGISALASRPEQASDYLRPLLRFAAAHIPVEKHKETPLYILCTAGMRLLSQGLQEAILEDIRTDVPLEFGFLFSDSHAEVISGKQEGVYAWIGINFVLGRFGHLEEDDPEVDLAEGTGQPAVIRKRTVGILDMGGASTQIAYEVPKSVRFSSAQQENVAKSLLSEFNLGCIEHQLQHDYRIYVATFLGSGANAVRERYEELLFNQSSLASRPSDPDPDPGLPLPDPCLPLGLEDVLERRGRRLFLRGVGDFSACRLALRPFLNGTTSVLQAVYRPRVDFSSSQFYGFSEFFYCTDDVLRMAGPYNSRRYASAASAYCATRWDTLQARYEQKLYSSHADRHRLKHQCFKSAWVYNILHEGFSFPDNYTGLYTAQLVYDREVQWTLGAIIYRTRFLPLRDINHQASEAHHVNRGTWRRYSVLHDHYLFWACFLVVALAILLYLLRLRRIHKLLEHAASSTTLRWVEEGIGP